MIIGDGICGEIPFSILGWTEGMKDRGPGKLEILGGDTMQNDGVRRPAINRKEEADPSEYPSEGD
ncbi:hypothetical protein N7466_003977 [Penicillium verhagenii]|uniref:uncharacterized protein n=1 Tax=Penicillium verhagenii TaxID=1562060 RepID=UPI002545101C|nr:uncharacterized protein N7466_003977 [Penicillium verhagenii]KAJ5934430.1 hypothetical protein N7466_003977 [Penicillium verhagenii]